MKYYIAEVTMCYGVGLISSKIYPVKDKDEGKLKIHLVYNEVKESLRSLEEDLHLISDVDLVHHTDTEYIIEYTKVSTDKTYHIHIKLIKELEDMDMLYESWKIGYPLTQEAVNIANNNIGKDMLPSITYMDNEIYKGEVIYKFINKDKAIEDLIISLSYVYGDRNVKDNIEALREDAENIFEDRKINIGQNLNFKLRPSPELDDEDEEEKD